jgi:hypothetical protein
MLPVGWGSRLGTKSEQGGIHRFFIRGSGRHCWLNQRRRARGVCSPARQLAAGLRNRFNERTL